MAKSKKQPTEDLVTLSEPIVKITDRERSWIELVYSDGIPLSLTWEGRKAETTRRLGYTITEQELSVGSRQFFLQNIKAEAYWSMVVMYHNVCESIRTPENIGEPRSNENSSYKVKIENSLKLKPVMDEIRRLAEDLFKKNEKAEIDFNAGKMESDFGEGALEAALREVNHEGNISKRKKAQAEA